MSLVHHVIKQSCHIAVAERELHLQQVWCDMALRYPWPQPALGSHPCMLLQGLCGVQNPLPLFVFIHVTLQTLRIKSQHVKLNKAVLDAGNKSKCYLLFCIAAAMPNDFTAFAMPS